MTKILMTGGGAPGAPGIIKCLNSSKKNYDLVVGDASNISSGRFLNKQFKQLPYASSERFVDFILDYSIKNKIDIIFPLVTKELFKFSTTKELFRSNGVDIIVSDLKGLEIANNKSKLYQFLDNNKINVPKFRILDKITSLPIFAKELGYPKDRVVIKPSCSNGSRGVRILDANIDYIDLIFNKKPTNLYTDLETYLNQIGKKDIPSLLISEYLPGKEITVDTIASNGLQKICLCRLRNKMSSGISIAGSFIEIPYIEEMCAKITSLLSLTGPIGFQFKEDEDGYFKIIEINPRIQGSSVTAMGMNINLAEIAVESTLNPSFDEYYNKKKSGINFIRFYDEIYYK